MTCPVIYYTDELPKTRTMSAMEMIYFLLEKFHAENKKRGNLFKK
jgi:hypothetical protein